MKPRFAVLLAMSGAFLLSVAAAATAPALPPPKLPEIKIHPRQPEMDLRAVAPEHGPHYTPPKDRFVSLFTPFETDRAALSPDGRYLAYTVRDGATVSVVVLEIDHPGKATARVAVASDETSTPMLAENQREKTPGQVRWMRWTTPTRLVVETNGAFAIGAGGGWSTRTGAVFAFDADGKNAQLIASPRDVLETLPNEEAIVPVEARNPHVIWTPDQPIPTPGADPTTDPFAATTGSNDLLSPSGFAPPEHSTTSVAQDIRVFDLAAKDPTGVLLQMTGNARSNGARHAGFVLLNSLTAKMQDLTYDQVPALMQGMVDRAGHVRITLPVTLLAAFPHAYEYLGPTGAGRPHDLSQSAGFPAGAAFALSPDNFFGHRAFPLGFDEDPNVLYYAANLGRDTYGIYSVNLATGQRGAIQFENPTFDLTPPIEAFGDGGTLVIDRFHHRLAGIRFDATLGTAAWVYPTFQAVQKTLEQSLPGHSVDIVEWDQTGNRFLVLASSPGDAGAFYVFDRGTGRLSEFVRRAPWIDSNQTHRSHPLVFKTAAGLTLTGLVTVPNHPRLTPMPVVLLCPDMPWQRVRPDFGDRVQALAQMGFLVVQLNGRGAWGFGVKHRAALAPGYDLVQVEDLMSGLDYVTQNYQVDAKRVAIVGDVHGGFIALRALQLHPDRFRCAVAVNAPVDLAGWLEEKRWTDGAAGPALTRGAFGDEARLKEAPLRQHPELIRKPILMMNYPGPEGAPRTSMYLAAKNLAVAVGDHVEGTEFADLSTDYMRRYPQALSDTYQRMEDFLNATVYDYKVKMGDAKVQPDAPVKR